MPNLVHVFQAVSRALSFLLIFFLTTRTLSLCLLTESTDVTKGEIALRWCIDQGIVALTTSASEDRLKQYQKITSFKLTTNEVEEIAKIGGEKHYRGFWQDKFGPDDRS